MKFEGVTQVNLVTQLFVTGARGRLAPQESADHRDLLLQNLVGSFHHLQLQMLSSQVLGFLSGPEEKMRLEAGMNSWA